MIIKLDSAAVEDHDGGAGEIDQQPISSSLNDNFGRMQVKSPINNQARGPHHEENKRDLPGSMMPTRYSAANDLNRSRTRMSSISDMYTPIRVLN